MRQKHVDRGIIRIIGETIAMTQESRSSSRGIAAWWLVVAVSVATVVGTIAGKYLFSTTKLIEKPVEVIIEKKVEVPVEVIKTVEKRVEVPVEVVKTVEKRVEVPAALTDAQKTSIGIVNYMLDAEKRQVGYESKALFPPEGKAIKVLVTVSKESRGVLSESEIRARVESVFRRDGFTILPLDGPYVATYVHVRVDLLLSDDNISLSGQLTLQVQQISMACHGTMWKRVLTTGNSYDHTISYGRNNFFKIPTRIEALAVSASNDLANAAILPLVSK